MISELDELEDEDSDFAIEDDPIVQAIENEKKRWSETHQDDVKKQNKKLTKTIVNYYFHGLSHVKNVGNERLFWKFWSNEKL